MRWLGVLYVYGVDPKDGKRYELDHLVPLCLGGADTEANLWPQPRWGEWGADKKDQLEAHLCRLACMGSAEDVARMQREIAADWIAAWKRRNLGP